MKRKMKKISALLMSMVLVFGILWIPTQAADTTEVTVSLAVENPTYAGTRVVYLNLNDVPKEQKYRAKGGSVKLDGVELSNDNEVDYAFNYGGWSNVHYIQLTNTNYTFKEGSVLTIGGIFVGDDGSTLIEIPEVQFQCHVSGTSYSWEIYTEKIDLTAPSISLSGSTVSWNLVTSATGYEICVDGEKKADTTETSYNLKDLKLDIGTYKITVKAVADNANPATSEEVSYSVTATKVQVSLAVENTTAGKKSVVYLNLDNVPKHQKYRAKGGSVKLDGVELSNDNEVDYAFNYGGWSNVHYIQLTNTNYTFEEGSVLTIGGIFVGDDGSTLIEIPEVQFQCHVSGTSYSWEIYTEKIDLTAPSISLSGSIVSWNLVTSATGYEICVDGEKKADTTETSYNLKNLKLGVGKYQITVKAVAENANPATSKAVSYSITATKVQVSVSDVNAINSKNNVLYLQVPSSLTDGKFAPVDGYVRLNGVELRYYVDGWTEIDYAFNRDSSELYVIQLTNTNYAFSDKAILTIGGTFVGTGGTLIDIEETHLVCEMKKNAEDKDVYDWTDVNLTMEGDLSGNGKWDMIDLIRMKRYIADGIATAYLNVTDINKDGKADADDVAILRGCIVGNTTMSDGQVTGKYLADKTLNIFADGPVEQTVESQLKKYFNAGFTTVQMTQDYVAMNESLTDNNGTLNSAYVNAIKTAMKYGDVMVRNHGSKADYFTADTFKQLYDLGVRQFYIWDEPLPHTNDKSADLNSVTKLAGAFNTLPEDTLFHVNLLPSYGPMKTTGWFWEETLSHTGYVDEYTNAISTNLTEGQEYTVSVDNYPLLKEGNIRKSYLTDLWTIANKAKSLGGNATVNFCIQTYSEKDNTELRVPETRADISFQTNVGLALGAQSFEYFEYYDWSAEDAITGILTNGLYDEVKSVNRELLAWDHVFMAFDWQGIKTYNVDEAYTNGITQLKELQKVYVSTGSEDDATVVGEYKYTKGNDTDYGYMITNFTDPSQEKTATVIVELVDSADKVLVYKNGVGTYMKPDGNNKITIKLGAGEGAFVIVD